MILTKFDLSSSISSLMPCYFWMHNSYGEISGAWRYVKHVGILPESSYYTDSLIKKLDVCWFEKDEGNLLESSSEFFFIACY